MFLKRLEIFGFKSFADKTIFDFEPGFICLVGPNGCGKSNVVDAVKWVLGEQSAKSLRGAEMQDIIFNGSGSRKPLNFSEVTLTFDNADSKLPLNAPEVSVTRRLYRTGESEYLINKAHCRLRDVRELFWDTGIGTSSYSIIEQNRIGLLVEANPKERRALFEEAAGIHKYKERKKIALRKLERVEINLARIADVLGEVERALKTVTRQAEKALKAQELTQKLRQIRLDILLNETFEVQNALGEVSGALTQAQEAVLTLTASLAAAQGATVSEQERTVFLDMELSGAQAQLSETRAQLAALEESIKSDRRTIEEAISENTRSTTAAAEAGQRAAQISNDRERAELDLETARASLVALQEKLTGPEGLEAAFKAAQGAHEQAVKTLDLARRESLDLIGRRSQAQQALSQAEAAVSGIDYRITKAKAELTKAEDLLRLCASEAEENNRRLEQLRIRREELETELSNLRALQARTENEIEQLNKQIQDSRGDLEKNRSRAAVLEELIESGEGLSPGVRSALTFLGQLAGVTQAPVPAQGENNQVAQPALEGGSIAPEAPSTESKEGDFYGLVADVLKVDPKYEAVIEAALGSNAESIVVGQKSTAQKVIAKLRDEAQGRANFLPLDAIKSAARALDLEINSIPGCLGRANEMTSSAGNIKPVADALLGDVLIFETLEQAEAAALPTVIGLSENGAEGEKIVAKPDLSAFRLVTLAGDVIERNGALEGGKGRPDRLGLIGRRNEVARLNGVMDELRAQLDVLAERHATLEKRAAGLEQDDERVVKELAELATKTNEVKGVLAGIAREENRSRSEQGVAVDEIRDLEQQRIKHDERATALRTDLTALTEQEVAAQNKANEWAASAQACESTLNTQRNSLEELRRESSNTSIRIESLERQCNELSARWAERRDEADRETLRANAASERRALFEVAASEKETQRDARSKESESLSASVERMAGEKESARMRFEEARGRERATSAQLEQARVQASEIERQKMEYQLRLTSKLEQGRNEFKIEVLDDLAQRGTPPEITPEAAEEAKQLDEKLQRLGPVNMYALEEQKQLAQRLDFLKTQHGDLSSAQNSLKDIIARINRRSRAQFQETFDAVRLQFQEIFRMLFGGGKADLILEQGEDVLEAGIEIMASPLGKSPRTTMQLSGGEKAMTTIALLFAVFRSRPAPFCILDEVDAPLDEANVDRFNQIVREFMDKSQFLVITHNKKTMGYADILFGVTMPEPGVSKRMAIKYEEIEKHLPMETIEREAAEKRKAALREVEAAAAKAAEEQQAAAELAGTTESVEITETVETVEITESRESGFNSGSFDANSDSQSGGTAVMEAPTQTQTEVMVVTVEQPETKIQASTQADAQAGIVTEQVEVAVVETKIEAVIEESISDAKSEAELEAEIDAEVEIEESAEDAQDDSAPETSTETEPDSDAAPETTSQLPQVDTLPSEETEDGTRDDAAMGGGTD